MREIRLPGGFVSDVVRVGQTVRRTPSVNSPFVRDLLALFAERGWTGAPRFLGVDQAGREILSFVEGDAAWGRVQPPEVVCDESLAAVAGLVRQFHDLTSGCSLAGDEQVVCHNDLSLKNTIYRDVGHGLRPIAFVDWDFAAPGPRIHDVAHLCWQFLNLGPSIRDPQAAVRGLRILCGGYGLTDRAGLVDAILWWQDRCWRGIESGADAGDPACARLRAAGVVADVRASWSWVRRHYRDLDDGIR